MSVHDEAISGSNYTRLCELIYREAGIRLGSDKRTMLEVRIKRRLKALDIESYGGYCDYLFGREGMQAELIHLIDVVTTNKTDFFREPGHFSYLVEKALPELTARGDGGRPLLVWSAGCSTGEEPYTLAIVLSEYALSHPGFRFRILATDISTTVLAKAEMGVYSDDTVNPVLSALRRKYFMRSRDARSDRMRVVPELRRLVEFRRLNFMDDDFGIADKADAIFCRNVIIYFDKETQRNLFARIAPLQRPGDLLFLGHSESLFKVSDAYALLGRTAYRRIAA